MYTLVKLFDKTILVDGEKITNLYWSSDGVTLIAVETDKSLYQVKKV